MRKDWDEYFLDMATEAASMSTCPRLSVGAILVKNNHPISTGFNGAPKKEKHCTEVGCKIVNGHCIRAIHAEENALLFAGIERAQGATLYVTHQPCYHCAGLIINAGVIHVVFKSEYESSHCGSQRLLHAGILPGF